ncbi:fumarylacetoacetate hydrolase family protein [Pseudoroseicyclus sp. CXY001]|uniref:fumarylacetoacetate hydrolase family protein n=1 Tax=Pseudoroseicyclus sp. CXY001 TaxID=3242492 RepID=UPI00358DB52C
MKFGLVEIGGKPVLVAATRDNGIVPLSLAFEAAGLGDAPATLAEIIADPQMLDRAREAIAAVDPGSPALLDPEGLSWLPPQPTPSKILGVAFNNMGIRKAAHVDPGVPNFFLKAPSALTGHGKPIVIKEHYGETIPELELACVIGRRCKEIGVDEALDAVFGYSIMNDVTSHGLKFGLDSIATTREPELLRPHHFGWRNRYGEEDRDVYYVYHSRSKASDTFGPMGPWVTTRDEVGNPNDLDVAGWIDGEAFAVDNTSSYRFKVEEVISEASHYFTLEPGDVICFGTSAKGVGRFPAGHRNINMHEMDGTIDIEIEGLGRLSNPIERRKKREGAAG